jgi:hypothetical protein
MDVGRILSDSLSLYKKNLKFILPHLVEYLLDIAMLLAFLAVVIVAIGVSIGSIAAGNLGSLLYEPSPFYILTFLIFGIVIMVLISIFFNACARGAIIGMAKEGYSQDRATLETGWESAKGFGPEIFVYLMFLILALGLLVSLGLLPMLFGHLMMALLLIFFFGFGFLILYLLTLFAPQEIVIEGKGVIKGIIGSIWFVRANIVGVLIYVAVAIGITMFTGFLSFIFSLPALFFAKYGGVAYIFARVIQNLITGIIGLIVAPYLEIVKTLMVMEGSRSEDKPEGIL